MNFVKLVSSSITHFCPQFNVSGSVGQLTFIDFQLMNCQLNDFIPKICYLQSFDLSLSLEKFLHNYNLDFFCVESIKKTS